MIYFVQNLEVWAIQLLITLIIDSITINFKCSCICTPYGFFWTYTFTTWLFSWNLSVGVGTPGGIDSEMIDSARDRDIILLLSWLLSSKSHLIRIRVRALAHRISVSIIVHKTPAKVDSEFSFVLSFNKPHLVYTTHVVTESMYLPDQALQCFEVLKIPLCVMAPHRLKSVPN